MNKRFKIDLNDNRYSIFPIALFISRSFLGFTYWKQLQAFETREEAAALYADVKDLPEYLA